MSPVSTYHTGENMQRDLGHCAGLVFMALPGLAITPAYPPGSGAVNAAFTQV